MATAKAKTKNGPVDFGAAYGELEEIVAWFEKEEVDLDEGLKKFERGLQLAELCKHRLEDVENKVVEIRARFGGSEGTEEGEE